MVMTEWMLGFGRAVASSLDAASNAITWSCNFLDPTGGENSTKEPPYGPLGWYGRPRPPVSAEEATPVSPAGECELLAWRQEDRTYIIGSKDLRLAKPGSVEGEVGMVGYEGGFVSLQPNPDDDGTNIFLYAPRRVDPPRAHTLQLITTQGNEQVTLLHMSGHSVVLNKEGQVMITGSTADGPSTGNTWISVDEGQGIVLNAANIGGNGFCMLGDKDPLVAGAEFVALALKVLTELQAIEAIFNAHTHTAPSGGGATSAPTPLLPSPSPVAATKVKAV